jgi:hypothetical protein
MSNLDFDVAEIKISEAISIAMTGQASPEECKSLAKAAMLAFHEYLISVDCWWDECQECGVGHKLNEWVCKDVK